MEGARKLIKGVFDGQRANPGKGKLKGRGKVRGISQKKSKQPVKRWEGMTRAGVGSCAPRIESTRLGKLRLEEAD